MESSLVMRIVRPSDGKVFAAVMDDGSMELSTDVSREEALRAFWEYFPTRGASLVKNMRLVADIDAVRGKVRVFEASLGLESFFSELEGYSDTAIQIKTLRMN